MISPVLAIVVPCFNEELVLKENSSRLNRILEDLQKNGVLDKKSFIEFVDDGSRDRTWEIIKQLSHENKSIKGLKLTRNVGHQNALLAGLMKAKGLADAVLSIDADLQQDENAIPEFVRKFKEGFDIVYGVRENRKTDGPIKKFTASFFYWLMMKMGVPILKDHADYRLVSKRALDALSNYNEANLFLRGLFPTLGFKSAIVKHEVRVRFAGESKYSFRKMCSFAINGVTSFSLMPIRVITALGFLIFVFSLLMSFYVVLNFLMGKTIVGWASTVLPIYFIGGIQLLSLGLIGEYIGRIYLETKRRPKYIIEEELN